MSAHQHIKSFAGDEVVAYLESDGAIILKAASPEGDPVELSSSEARAIARHLVFLADQEEAD